MHDYSEFESVKLFWKVEALRKASLTTIKEMAFLCGVTELAYKNWKNKRAVPHASRVGFFLEILNKFSTEKNFRRQYLKNVRRIQTNQQKSQQARKEQAKRKSLNQPSQ